MSASHMGSTLRERREELGISLEMAAVATNIRARLLAVLEEGDYANFPPYGHAMGMITSYARYLETDPRPILQEFEREWGEYERASSMAASAERTRRGVGRYGERVAEGGRPSQRTGRFARDTRPSTVEGAPGAMSAKLSDERVAEEDDRYKSGTVRVVGTRQTGQIRRVGAGRRRGAGEPAGTAGESRPRQGGRSAAAAGSTSRSSTRASSRYSRDNGRYSSRSGSASSERRRDRTVPAAEGRGAGNTGASRRASSASRSSSGSTGTGSSQAPDFFSIEKLDREQRKLEQRQSASARRRRASDAAAPADENIVQRVVSIVQEAFSERRTRVIASGIAAFVLVVVIVAAVLISTAGSGDNGVIAVQGGAADTTTSTSDPNSASATVTTTNGNPVTVDIDVAEGQTSLINVTYDDDNAYSGTAVGAWHREFLVTESLEATFGNPDAVTVTENGNQVNIEKNDDGTGSMSLTIKTTSTSTTSGSSADSSSSSKKKSKKKSSSSSSSSSDSDDSASSDESS